VKKDDDADSMFERDSEAIFEDIDLMSCLDSISEINERDDNMSSLDSISQSLKELQKSIMDKSMVSPEKNSNFQMEAL
jgi:hypothetical protein